MITLLCPRCSHPVEAASPSAPAPPCCPRCGAALGPAPPTLSAPDTTASNASATLVTAPSELFPFLAPPRQSDEIGWLGTYRVRQLLGQGGMGIVFLAEDTQLERPVALKVMNAEGARDPEARRRFLREARMMAALRSDHIVTIHQVGEVNNVPYLAMEFLQGETLAAWLERGRRPTLAQVLDIGLQVARGLESAHAAGLVHRDIKPANLWIEPGGRIKILDFGLARLTQDSATLTQRGMVVGTPAYMAPEQAEGAALDGRTDLFSLGCVLYELAAGEQPFAGPTPFAVLTAMVVRDPKPLHEVDPAIPRDLSRLVVQMLAKRPAERIASATAVIEALEAIAAAHPDLRPVKLSGAQRQRMPIPTPPRRRWPIVVAALLVVLLGMGGAAWWLSRPRSTEEHPPAPDASVLGQGVSDTEILLGMSAPYQGPAVELGRAMRDGILTCIGHVNDQGGVHGRKLRLIALDDRFEPERALANMRELYEQHKVFAVIGNVGAATAEITVPYALEKKLIFFGAFTGGHILRKVPPDRYVFNYRAGLAEETSAIVTYLIETRKLRPEEIAAFTQDDAYGDNAFRGVERTLRRYGRQPEQILHVRYPRNTTDVAAAAREIIRHKEVRAVVMVPVYRPAARFIQQVREAGRDVIFTSTAFVNAAALVEELRQIDPKQAEGVIVTQVVPPVASHASLVLRYRELLGKYASGEAPNSVSLEGYITATLFVEGLRRAGERLHTEALIDALEGIHDLDLGLGVRLSFGPSEHQASHKVWAIVHRAGRFEPLDLE
ncbi:MAG: ABC transporter substrate-binding protein [Gemmataceae bacterium]